MSENAQDTSQEVLPDLAALVASLRAELAQCKAEHALETQFRIATEGFANKADAERDAAQALAERYRLALEAERDNHKRCIDRVQALNAQEDAIANAVHAACTALGLDVWNVGIPERATMLCGKAKYYQEKAKLLEQDLGVLRKVRDEVAAVTAERDKAIKRALSAEKGWEDSVRLLDSTTSAAAVERDEAEDLKTLVEAFKEETAELKLMLESERSKLELRRGNILRQAEYIRVLKHEVDAVREVLTAERKRADAAEAEIARLSSDSQEVPHG